MKICDTILLLAAMILLLLPSCRKSDFIAIEEKPTFRDMGEGTGTITWKKGNDYLLEGLVFVNDGQVLTIEPGAVIRFREGQGENCLRPGGRPRRPDHRPGNPLRTHHLHRRKATTSRRPSPKQQRAMGRDYPPRQRPRQYPRK